MTTVAIICEYNPFHLGHAYQISRIREEYGSDACIISLMSGNFVQRGTPAIFDKYTRAKAALFGGVNLVLEFPFPFAVSGANYFAKHAVSIIDSLGVVDVLSFGVETNQVEQMHQLADCIATDAYEEKMKLHLENAEKHLGFAEIRERVLAELCPSLPRSLYREPNNILAVEYLVALKKRGSSILPHTVARTVDYHAKEVLSDGTASASFIRSLMTDGNFEIAMKNVPFHASALYQESISKGFWVKQSFVEWGKILLSHLRLAPASSAIFESSKELSHRIANAAVKAKNYSDLIDFSQTAHLTKARVQRAVLHTWLGTPSSFAQASPVYTQLLAADETGLKKLKQIHQNGHIKVLTKPADTHLLCPLGKTQADFCAKADGVYSLLQTSPGCGDEFFRKSPYCVR